MGACTLAEFFDHIINTYWISYPAILSEVPIEYAPLLSQGVITQIYGSSVTACAEIAGDTPQSFTMFGEPVSCFMHGCYILLQIRFEE